MIEVTTNIFLIGLKGKEHNKLQGALENTKNVVIFSFQSASIMVKKVLGALLMLVMVMQLLQPTKNVSKEVSENDISNVYALPVDVQNVLTQKCYDCHSNNTHYPWYIHIQPIGWWMASHIKDAKDHLNFSEFKTYNEKKASRKLGELVEEVTEGSMPLKSYVWLHSEAKVTPSEIKAISDWVKTLGVDTEKEDD